MRALLLAITMATFFTGTAPALVTTPVFDGNRTVYVTKTGTKYHRSDCRYLSKSKISKKLRDAKAEGYEACKVCKP